MSPFQLLHTFFLFCLISLFPTLLNAYSWQLNAIPSQCTNISLSIVGDDGRPPYRVSVIPFGPSPLPGSIEVRNFIDLPFDGNSTFIDFPVNYPARSQFVAVVSDATGFATGGTSHVITVGSSNDASCFNAGKDVPQRSPSFSVFPHYFTQCLPTLIRWNEQGAQGSPETLFAVVPGGQSFTIPTTNSLSINSLGDKGFFWVTLLPAGTTFALISNGSHGIGSGNTTVYSVGYSDDRSCLNGTNPSPIDENSPGAISATGSTDNLNTATGTGTKSKRVNIAVIVGSILSGIIVVLLLTLLYIRRKRCTKKPCILDDSSDLGQPYFPATLHSKQSSRDLEPNRLLFDPYLDPRWSLANEEKGYKSSRNSSQLNDTLRTSDDRFSTTHKRSQRRGTSSSTRLVIQHGDAGPSSSPSQSSQSADERGVVELPPAYTSIRASVNYLQRFRFYTNQSKGG